MRLRRVAWPVLRPASSRRIRSPGTGDGSLVDDPAVRAPLVLNNRSFHDITEIVCGYAEKPPGRWWLPTFMLAFTIAARRSVHRLPGDHRHRHLGHEQRRGLGVGHHQLRLLDRYRPRRNADLRHSLLAEAEVAPR